jgi:hypothetical protein
LPWRALFYFAYWFVVVFDYLQIWGLSPYLFLSIGFYPLIHLNSHLSLKHYQRKSIYLHFYLLLFNHFHTRPISSSFVNLFRWTPTKILLAIVYSYFITSSLFSSECTGQKLFPVKASVPPQLSFASFIFLRITALAFSQYCFGILRFQRIHHQTYHLNFPLYHLHLIMAKGHFKFFILDHWWCSFNV